MYNIYCLHNILLQCSEHNYAYEDCIKLFHIDVYNPKYDHILLLCIHVSELVSKSMLMFKYYTRYKIQDTLFQAHAHS